MSKRIEIVAERLGKVLENNGKWPEIIKLGVKISNENFAPQEAKPGNCPYKLPNPNE